MANPPFPVFQFSFRVVTPLFLGGAQPKDFAELRPPAIKGLLREWYRVIVGADVARDNEARFFGGTTEKSGQCPFLLSVDRAMEGMERWERQRVSAKAISGLNYLGFTLNMGENIRKGIAPGSQFELGAAFPRGAHQEAFQEQRRALLGTLWLLAHLGGVGSRSRRGIGSLALEKCQLDKASESDSIPLAVEAADFFSVCACLEQGLAMMGDWFGRERRNSTDGEPRPGFDLRTSRIVVVPGANAGKAWNRPLEALDYIGGKLQELRRKPDIDGFPTTRLLVQNARLPHAPYRTAFGLPLTYRLPTGKDTYRPPKEKNAEFAPFLLRKSEHAGSGWDFARHPSHLLVHIQKLQGGYLPVLTLLGGARPGRDIPVREKRGRSYLQPVPKNDLPERFLDSLIAEGAREVRR